MLLREKVTHILNVAREVPNPILQEEIDDDGGSSHHHHGPEDHELHEKRFKIDGKEKDGGSGARVTIRYLHLPLDFNGVGEDELMTVLERATGYVENVVGMNGVVVIHCSTGDDRAATVALACLLFLGVVDDFAAAPLSRLVASQKGRRLLLAWRSHTKGPLTELFRLCGPRLSKYYF